ncbi:MAG: flagellar basal body P-ring formation protein FlgA [Firmicutes bacterium]|nr:flagellar basal body P-ring formation protein FlgA [Bacillota bacterium]
MGKLMRLKHIIIVIIFVLVLCGTVEASVIITIPDRVVINKSWIELGDIATIKGLAGEDLMKLSSIKLGKATLPGYSREIPRGQLILLLKDNDLSISDIDLVMGESVIVETISYQVSSKKILAQAKEYLLKSLTYPPERITIREKFIPPNIVVPAKNYQLEFVIPGDKSLNGDISLQVKIIIDGAVYKNIFVRLQVSILQDVFIAKRRILRGEKISESDFSLETREVGDFRGDLITDLDSPLVEYGKVSKYIPEGTVLTSDYLDLPIIVKVGDEIVAEIKMGAIIVTTKVEARQRGKKGEYIIVENLKTGRRFKAMIINPHLVRLEQ